MSHYALVVMVEHGQDADLPELSSRRPRHEAERYYIAANDDEMAKIAADYGLDAEHQFLRAASAPMIEVDAARIAARSIEAEAGRQSRLPAPEEDPASTAGVRLADLEQAIGLIAARSQPTQRETVRAYLERLEGALAGPV